MGNTSPMATHLTKFGRRSKINTQKITKLRYRFHSGRKDNILRRQNSRTWVNVLSLIIMRLCCKKTKSSEIKIDILIYFPMNIQESNSYKDRNLKAKGIRQKCKLTSTQILLMVHSRQVTRRLLLLKDRYLKLRKTSGE